MKKIFMLALLFVSSNSLADQVYLDCNISLGQDQQVKVVEKNGSLYLLELTNFGSWISRPLSTQEWQKQQLQLRRDQFGETMLLSKTKTGWMFKSSSALGYADCR